MRGRTTTYRSASIRTRTTLVALVWPHANHTTVVVCGAVPMLWRRRASHCLSKVCACCNWWCAAQTPSYGLGCLLAARIASGMAIGVVQLLMAAYVQDIVKCAADMRRPTPIKTTTTMTMTAGTATTMAAAKTATTSMTTFASDVFHLQFVLGVLTMFVTGKCQPCACIVCICLVIQMCGDPVTLLLCSQLVYMHRQSVASRSSPQTIEQIHQCQYYNIRRSFSACQTAISTYVSVLVHFVRRICGGMWWFAVSNNTTNRSFCLE